MNNGALLKYKLLRRLIMTKTSGAISKSHVDINTIVVFILNNMEEKRELPKIIVDVKSMFPNIEIIVVNNIANCTSQSIQDELKSSNIKKIIDASKLL